MRHVSIYSSFQFSTEPFPAFRYDFVDDLGERQREFLPVQGVTPSAVYIVTASDGTTLYYGEDESAANAAKDQYYENPFRSGSATVASVPILPEGAFRLIWKNGKVAVASGQDTTDRCLLFVGCYAGYGRSQSLLEAGTTGSIVTLCPAGEEGQSSTEAIALLDVGQALAFLIAGERTTDEVHLYTWTGEEVEFKVFVGKEWDYYQNLIIGDAEDEVV